MHRQQPLLFMPNTFCTLSIRSLSIVPFLIPSRVVLAKSVNNPPLLKTSKNPSGLDSFKLWTGFVYSFAKTKS